MNTEQAQQIGNQCRDKVDGVSVLQTSCKSTPVIFVLLLKKPSRIRRFFNWLKRVVSAVFTGLIATASNNPEQEYMK